MDILFKSKKNVYLKSVDIIFPVVTTGSLDFSNFEKDSKMRMAKKSRSYLKNASNAQGLCCKPIQNTRILACMLRF
jgi:hypothetical protein